MDTEALRAYIFREKPIFGDLVEKWKYRTWSDYYTQDFETLRTPSDLLLKTLARIAAKDLHSWEEGERVSKSIHERRWVSTADHHGLLCHPYFYGGNVAQSEASLRKGVNVHVSFSFGNISLGNDSFPRGFFFHDANGMMERFIFKSLQDRSIPLTTLPALSRADFLREYDRVASVPLSGAARARLHTFLDALRETPGIWDTETYGEQLTRMNSVLWDVMFSKERGSFYYLEIDRIAKELLLTHHLCTETNIHHLLFDHAWRALYHEYFEGIQGAHRGDAGTHFFWYIDPIHRRRRSLWMQGESLHTTEGDVSIHLDPETIAEGLGKGTLVCGTALLLLIVHGEEGLTAAGGISQLEYLPRMMASWNRILTKLSLPPLPSTNTSIIGAEYTLFGMQNKEGQDILASFFDLLLYEEVPQARVREALENTTIGDTIDAMLPILYSLITRQKMISRPSLHIPLLTRSV